MKKLLLLSILCLSSAQAEETGSINSQNLTGKYETTPFATGAEALAIYENLPSIRYVLYTPDVAGFVSVSVKFGENTVCFDVFDETSAVRVSCHRLTGEVLKQ
jgi:hypothetical protein